MKKNNPNKGFISEIEKNPKVENIKKDFKYKEAVVSPSSNAMNTPKRIANFRSVAEPKSNICTEFSKHVDARRKK